MRVLTFNVWSDVRTWQRRLPAIYDTLRDMEFDLVALQEVPVDDEWGPGVAQRIAEQAGYPYAEFRPYAPGEKDGLAVLSRTRLDGVKSGRDSGREGLEECALRVTTQIQGQELVLTNVHLDAGGIDRREQEILALNGWIEGHPSSGLDLLCGDFNCSPASSVYRFLTGEQTLANQSSGRIIKRSGGPWQDAVALNHGIRPDSGLADCDKCDGGMPPDLRNHLEPTGGDTPASRAASSLERPVAIAAQNRTSSSRRAESGRPGECNLLRPDRSDRRLRTVIATSYARVLRRPVEPAQYTCGDYRKLLRLHGIKASMSRKGNCLTVPGFLPGARPGLPYSRTSRSSITNDGATRASATGRRHRPRGI